MTYPISTLAEVQWNPASSPVLAGLPAHGCRRMPNLEHLEQGATSVRCNAVLVQRPSCPTRAVRVTVRRQEVNSVVAAGSIILARFDGKSSASFAFDAGSSPTKVSAASPVLPAGAGGDKPASAGCEAAGRQAATLVPTGRGLP